MAEIGDWANAAGGIPLGIMQGYNYGQREQRAEEKALADIEAQRLRNELLGYGNQEYMSPEQAERRRLETSLGTTLAQLGITTTGANLEAAQAGRGDIVAGLISQQKAARAGAETQAKRAELGLELFGDRATVERAQAKQDVDLLEKTLGLRAARQGEQIGQVESNMRAFAERARQSGAIDAVRNIMGNDPSKAPIDAMLEAWRVAPDAQKGDIVGMMVIENQKDLQSVTTPEALDQWMQRPAQRFPGRAWVNQNPKLGPVGGIAYATKTGQKNERGEDLYGTPVVVPDMEQVKISFGIKVQPAVRQPATKPVAPTGTGLGGTALTSGQGGAAAKTTPPAPAAAPAVAPAAAPAAAPAVAPAAAAPVAAPAPQIPSDVSAQIEALVSEGRSRAMAGQPFSDIQTQIARLMAPYQPAPAQPPPPRPVAQLEALIADAQRRGRVAAMTSSPQAGTSPQEVRALMDELSRARALAGANL
jgi:hypothetical protein